MRRHYQLLHVLRQGDNLYHLARYYQTTVPGIIGQNPRIDPYDLQIGKPIVISPGKQFFTSTKLDSLAFPNVAIPPALSNNMREAWMQHVYWERMLIISIAENLNDVKAVGHRLLENPVIIANIFASYYTADIANVIRQLFVQHLKIEEALVTALKDKNAETSQSSTRQWYANADQMAETFGHMNPYYSQEGIREMLYTHLDLTIHQAKMRIEGNYASDIDAFNHIESEVLEMADYFTKGIMNQFPQKFT